jgi:predicted nucleic acid-binding protein
MRTYTTTISKHGGFDINSNLWQQEAIAAVNANYHNMKITKDNFVWKLVDEEQAEFIFSLDLFDLYELHDDDSESLIETFDEIKNIFIINGKVGIEVGFIKNDKL